MAATHDFQQVWIGQGIKEMDPVPPLESWADGETTVYDFGQNCRAYARIAVRGPASPPPPTLLTRCGSP